MNSHHAADAAVSFHNALAIDVTRVGLTVGAKPGAMAASYLVTCEAGLTRSAAEGALVTRIPGKKSQPLTTENDSVGSCDLTIVL